MAETTGCKSLFSFTLVNVPDFPPELYQSREEDERVFKAIIQKCQKPGKVLVVAGEAGIGKTTLLARLFRTRQTYEPPDGNVDVLWLNCYKWSEAAGFDARQFESDLIELAQCAHGSCAEKITEVKQIVPHFRDKHNSRVLFIFDDVFNERLLQHFIKKCQTDISQLSCCVITPDPVTLDQKLFAEVEKLQQMETSRLSKMFQEKGVYDLSEKLQPPQIEELAIACCGLPLMASLVWSWFEAQGSSDDAEPALRQLMTEGLNPFQGKVKAECRSATVSQLFEFIIKRLTDERRRLYFVFLFFDPAEQISIVDLQLLWRRNEIDSREAFDNFIAKSLVMAAGKNEKNEDCIVVHQMLWESLRDYVLNQRSEMVLKTDEDKAKALEAYRMKIVMGDGENAEPVVFEALRQQRRRLLRQIILKLNAESLTKLGNASSKEMFEDSKVRYRRSFLHLLYYFDWEDNVRLQGYLKTRGINHSYRLIAEMLLKIKAAGDNEMLASIAKSKATSMARNNDEQSSFLHAVFKDEGEEVQKSERFLIIQLLTPWRWIYDNMSWRNEKITNSETPSLVKVAIRGKLAEVKSMYASELTLERCVEAIAAAARCNSEDVLKYLDEQKKDAAMTADSRGTTALHLAAQFGNFSIAQYLAEKHPTLITMVNNNGETALHFAGQNGHLEIVRFVISKHSRLVTMIDSEGWTALHSAAQNGHLDVVRFLVEKHRNLITMSDNDGWTTVHLAAQNGHFEVLRFLVEQNPNLISVTTDDGITALYSAALNGHFEIVQYLVEKQPKLILVVNSNGLTVLHSAARNGHFEIVRFLVEKQPKLIKMVNINGFTPLHSAAQNGHLEIVRFLGEKQPSLVSMAAKDGSTALHSAALNGHLEMFWYLIGTNSNLISMATKNGFTVLHLAAQNGHLEIVRFLVEKHPDLTSLADVDGWTALHLAAQNGHLEVLRFVAEEQPQLITLTDKDGWTALHLAAQNGHLSVVRYLAEIHPKLLSMVTNDGLTALYSAARQGRLEVVRFLDQAEPNLILIANSNGFTVLHSAAQNGHLEIVRYFDEKHSSLISRTANDGATALHSAAQEGHLAIVEYLDEKHPDLTALADSDGYTTLHLAAQNGHGEMVRFFVEKYSDLTAIATSYGYTALHLATQNGHIDIVRYLVEQNPCMISMTTNKGKTAADVAEFFHLDEIVNFLRHFQSP